MQDCYVTSIGTYLFQVVAIVSILFDSRRIVLSTSLLSCGNFGSPFQYYYPAFTSKATQYGFFRLKTLADCCIESKIDESFAFIRLNEDPDWNTFPAQICGSNYYKAISSSIFCKRRKNIFTLALFRNWLEAMSSCAFIVFFLLKLYNAICSFVFQQAHL